jgi:nucleoside-diphosphate-sugar epimerase
MPTALVTGANGFTASYVCRQLIEKGYKVRGLVRKNADMKLIEGVPVEFHYTDLAVDKDISSAMEGIDVVYHTAAAFRTENVPRKYFWDVNVEGTRNLLAAAKTAGVKKFVHLSTVGVQGDIENPPAKEDYRYSPGDYYQESKVEGEKLVLQFYQKEQLPIAIVRPFGIYGPGDTRFLKLFKHIYNGKFRMIGSGNVLYQMTYVEDLARGLILAGEKNESIGEIVAIGGDEYLTLNDLVEKISKLLNKPVPKFKIPLWPVWFGALLCEIVCKPFGISPPIYRRRIDFFVKDRAFDISKAKRLLGYQPKVPLDEGLKITADWYKKKGLFTFFGGWLQYMVVLS